MKLHSAMRASAFLALGAGLVALSLGFDSTGVPQAGAGGRPEPYYRDDELPGYPNALEYPLGDGLTVNGVPFRLSHFTTDDPAARVRDYYLAAFEKMNAPHKLFKTAGGGFTITAAVSGGASQAVVAIAPHKDVTEVFPSVFPMMAGPPEDILGDTDLPYSPTAVGVMKVSDKARMGDVFTWQEPLSTVAGAMARLKEELPRRGWALTSFQPRLPKGEGHLVALKGPRQVRLALTPYRSQSQGVSVVAVYTPVEALP